MNRMTGFTANMMMLGREVNTPADLMFPPKHHGEQSLPQQSPHEYIQGLVSTMERAHETARQSMKTASNRMKRNYDLRILERNYEVGDTVYLLDTATVKGKCKKLSPPWKGPAVIVSKLSSYHFRVKLRNAVFVVNHDRIKPCGDRDLPHWIKAFNKCSSDEGKQVTGDDRIYCFCRQPWQGRFMIQCDHCQEWYHGSCVDITQTDAYDIDKYKCRDCIRRSKRSDS